MRPTAAAPRIRRRTLRPAALGLVVVTAAIVRALVQQPASPSPPSFSEGRSADGHRAAPISASSSSPSPSEGRRGDHARSNTAADGAVTEADGALPEGVTVFDGEYRGIANLDPDLLHALREAATDAAGAGIEFYVNSGWRSGEYQNQLLRQAVSRYGSMAEAARWVATPETSPHVSGDAVDLGSSPATAWLSRHGAHFGLCQIYGNEPWHFELRPKAVERGCPRMYADPTDDPRMQR
jgi:zinc D-Ala-D-Ala carboxypeptidase